MLLKKVVQDFRFLFKKEKETFRYVIKIKKRMKISRCRKYFVNS